MLTHPTVDKLHELRCTGMGQGDGRATRLATGPEPVRSRERLGLLVDRELTERHSRQLTNRLRRARLRHDACIEDIDFRAPRGARQGPRPVSGRRGAGSANTSASSSSGPPASEKSWIACALAHSACRHGHSASYRRLPRLLTELAIARADGSYPKLLASLAQDRGSWSSTTSASPSSAPRTAATCSRLPKTAMASAPL